MDTYDEYNANTKNNMLKNIWQCQYNKKHRYKVYTVRSQFLLNEIHNVRLLFKLEKIYQNNTLVMLGEIFNYFMLFSPLKKGGPLVED